MKRLVLLILPLIVLMPFPVSGEGSAKISFSSVKHDFGVINEVDGQVECEFVFTNIGTAPLVITKTATSCECTLARYSKQSVAPGKQGRIKVLFSPIGVKGNFMKNIYVYSNGAEPITLYIKGKVKPVGR